MYQLIHRKYNNKPYFLHEFKEYYEKTPEKNIQQVRECYPQLSELLDRIKNGEDVCLQIKAIFRDDFSEYDNICVTGQVIFTCQFMANVDTF